MNPINVREVEVDEDGEKLVRYGLIDGLQRFTAAKLAGLDEIPAQIIPLEEAELLEAQIIANVQKIDTKPVEYSRALAKLISQNPLLTKQELASRLHKTTTWISERLGLLKLEEGVAEHVDNDNIGLSNAYLLAKLPPEDQLAFLDRAMAMPPDQFAAAAQARLTEIRKAKREGREAKPDEFTPVAILRKRPEVIAEHESPVNGKRLINKFKPANQEEAWKLAISWVLSLDADSIAVQEAKDKERREERKRRTEAASVERKQKRAKEAAEKAAKLQAEAEEALKEKKEAMDKAAAAATN